MITNIKMVTIVVIMKIITDNKDQSNTITTNPFNNLKGLYLRWSHPPGDYLFMVLWTSWFICDNIFYLLAMT